MGHGSEKPTQQSLQLFSQDQAKRNPQNDRKYSYYVGNDGIRENL